MPDVVRHRCGDYSIETTPTAFVLHRGVVYVGTYTSFADAAAQAGG